MPYKSVRIDDDHVEFLNKNPEVNFSALVRQTLNHRMLLQKKLNEVSFAAEMLSSDDGLTLQAIDDPADETERSVTIEITPNEVINE